jgi:hypothetical protein
MGWAGIQGMSWPTWHTLGYAMKYSCQTGIPYSYAPSWSINVVHHLHIARLCHDLTTQRNSLVRSNTSNFSWLDDYIYIYSC